MAIAGLAISFPLMNLVVAFCTLVSAGGSTLASIRLGQKDLKGATEILSHTLMLCITNSVFFGILSFIFLDDILLFFGASHDTLPYARSFMQVILLGTPITYTMIGLNNVMRATGYPKKNFRPFIYRISRTGFLKKSSTRSRKTNWEKSGYRFMEAVFSATILRTARSNITVTTSTTKRVLFPI